jgi:hypothetical protein
VELWAGSAEPQSEATEQSNAPANLPKGSAFIERIVVNLNLSCGN